MTIIDRPESQREAPDWTALAEAQSHARDMVNEFLDAPSSVAFGKLLASMNSCLDTERRLLDLEDRPFDGSAEFEEQHLALAMALNAVTWETPGGATVWSSTSRLRHALLRQIELTQRLSRNSSLTN